MAIILRRTKGSTLTHDELDDNFQQLSISNLDSAKVKAMIDSDFVQIRIPETYLATLIDSDYVEDRVTHRDSAFVTGIVDSAYILGIAPAQDFLDSSEVINLVDSAYVQSRVTLRDSSFVSGIVDSAYLSVIVDSDYISNRSSSGGGLGGIEFTTTATSYTKVGDGDVYVELAGGGGGGSTAPSTQGGNSFGRGIFHNVADGSTITISSIGAGGAVYGISSGLGGTGGSTTVYVDSANGQKLIMGGGGGSSASGPTRGGDAYVPSASGGATALYGQHGQPTGSSRNHTGFGSGGVRIQSGNGIGGSDPGGGHAGNGTAGAVLLIGV
jgi:hypothetical protein